LDTKTLKPVLCKKINMLGTLLVAPSTVAL